MITRNWIRASLLINARARRCAVRRSHSRHGLSGDERRVTGWLRKIRHNRSIRILDEPLNALDPDAVETLLHQLNTDRSQWITIVISHDTRIEQLPQIIEHTLVAR